MLRQVEKKAFLFYASTLDIIEELPKKRQGKVAIALIEYGLDDFNYFADFSGSLSILDSLERIIFRSVIYEISVQKRRYYNKYLIRGAILSLQTEIAKEDKSTGLNVLSDKERAAYIDLINILEEGVLERDIFVDKQSGKDFSRPAYQQMIQSLQQGDEIVILDLDRLGRNYSEMAKEWGYITEEKECDIRVINYPLLSTAQEEKTLDKRFIAKLTFEILSYVAEKEREDIKRRQREGIESAKAKGVKFGRTKIPRPNNFIDVYNKVLLREITNRQAMVELGLKANTYYSFVKEYKECEDYEFRRE